jgi:hypothetical protein
MSIDYRTYVGPYVRCATSFCAETVNKFFSTLS